MGLSNVARVWAARIACISHSFDSFGCVASSRGGGGRGVEGKPCFSYYTAAKLVTMELLIVQKDQLSQGLIELILIHKIQQSKLNCHEEFGL